MLRLFLLCALAAVGASQCVGGLTGKCEPNLVISEGDFCSFDCNCNGAAKFNDTFTITTTCERLFNNTYSTNATFQWLSISSGGSKIDGSVVVNGGPSWRYSAFSGFEQNATAASITPLPSNTFISNLTIFNISQLNAHVAGGAMSCVPFRGPGTYDQTSVATMWMPSDGMKADYVNVDFVIRNVSADGSAQPWVVARASLAPNIMFRYYFPQQRQCNLVEVAFLSTFNVSGFPAIQCPQTSSSFFVALRVPPSTPALLNFTYMKQENSTNYTVIADWLPALDDGGCANVTYMRALYTLYTGAWGLFNFVDVVGSAQQRWIVRDVPMKPGMVFQLSFRSRSVAGEGPSVYSDPFGLEDTNHDSSTSPFTVGQTVGIALGGAAALILIVVVVLFAVRRRRQGYSKV